MKKLLRFIRSVLRGAPDLDDGPEALEQFRKAEALRQEREREVPPEAHGIDTWRHLPPGGNW